MKTQGNVWWLIALASMTAAAVGCGDGTENDFIPDDPADPGEDVVYGENKIGLVYYDGQWIPACSRQKSRCSGSTGYEQCSWSVERPGTEDWFRGDGCDSGYVCRESAVYDSALGKNVTEARCEYNGGGGGGGGTDRIIRCDEIGDQLRLTISGNPVGGGLISDPPYPEYIQYAGGPIPNENGWAMPYPSGTARSQVTYSGGNGPWSLYLHRDVTDFALYMSDRYNSSNGRYFNLSNNRWRIEGGCSLQLDSGTSDSYHLHRTKVPSGGGGGGSGGPGSIMCDYNGANTVVTVRGPFTSDRLYGWLANGVLQYGADTAGSWTPTELANGGRGSTSWNNDSGTYTMNLPYNVNGFNMCVAPYQNAPSCIWFNLDNSSWTVGGDCYRSGTKLFVTR